MKETITDLRGNPISQNGLYLVTDDYGNRDVVEVKDGYYYDRMDAIWRNCRTVLFNFTPFIIR